MSGIKPDKEEAKILELWFLSCQDMKITEGTCNVCDFKDVCQTLRKKILDYIELYPHLRNEKWQF